MAVSARVAAAGGQSASADSEREDRRRSRGAGRARAPGMCAGRAPAADPPCRVVALAREEDTVRSATGRRMRRARGGGVACLAFQGHGDPWRGSARPLQPRRCRARGGSPSAACSRVQPRGARGQQMRDGEAGGRAVRVRAEPVSLERRARPAPVLRGPASPPRDQRASSGARAAGFSPPASECTRATVLLKSVLQFSLLSYNGERSDDVKTALRGVLSAGVE